MKNIPQLQITAKVISCGYDKIQILPLPSEIEKVKSFLGCAVITDPAITAFLAASWQLIPSYDCNKSKAYNKRVLSWHVAQFRFIADHAGFQFARVANPRKVLTILQYGNFFLNFQQRAFQLLVKYSTLETTV